MQKYVGEKRTDDSALWGSGGRVFEQSPLHYSGSQEGPDQIEDLTIVDTTSKELHQLLMINRVKIRGDVTLDDPEVFQAFHHIRPQMVYCIHRAACGAESVGVLTEVSLKYRL